MTGPEDTKRLGDAYELALETLDLKKMSDPLTEMIAKLIIEIARPGEKKSREDCRTRIELPGWRLPRWRELAFPATNRS